VHISYASEDAAAADADASAARGFQPTEDEQL